jgi:hypothetical protein
VSWELAGEAFAAHRHEGTAAAGGALTLAAGRAEGTFTAALPLGAPIDRAVTSLNPDPWPAGSRARVRLRAEVAGAWTPWAPLGEYGAADGLPRSEVGPDPDAIEVRTDEVRLPRPATRLELRVELTRGADGGAPRLRRLAACAWRAGPPEADPPSGPARPAAWGRELAVPERSQGLEDPAIAGRICSPTSLSMVLAFWGHDLPTAEVARRVHDHAAAIYGNWSFNVAAAGALGLRAVVERCASFAPLEAELAAGRPAVISHRWGPGELTGGTIDQSDGHLIVVRGFTPEGDLIVNDPAATPRQGAAIRRVYRRQDIARSWLGNAAGVCYLLSPGP